MDAEEEEEEDDDVEEENQSQGRKAHFVRACAIETHMDISQDPFCVGIYRKNAGPQARDTRFVRACAIETHMDISQEPFCVEIYRKNAGPQARGTRFLRACAVETHMDISQEPFCVEIYRKNAPRAGYDLDQTPGLNPHRKNPFSVATLFGGKKAKNKQKWSQGASTWYKCPA